MRFSILLPAALLLSGCIHATADDTVSDSEDMHFNVPTVANIPLITCDANGPVFSTSTSTQPFDLSDFFSQLEKQGSVSVDFNDNSLHGDLSSFKHAQLFIQDFSGKQTLLAETDFKATNGVVNVPIVMNSDALLSTLAAGKVQVNTTLQTCIPSNNKGVLDIGYTLGATVHFTTDKGI